MNKKLLIPIIIVLAIPVLLFLYSRLPESQSQVQEKVNAQMSPGPQDASPSGELKIEDIQVGEGPEVKPGDTVVINYTGTLADGTKFDSSLDKGQPFETKIGVGDVISGWDQGIPGMKVGGKRKLTIPPSLGYGASGYPPVIPSNATLIFNLELLEIK